MSLILKQETTASIPTPPAGKGTLFINENAALSVRAPDGNVALYATASGSNTQVFFNDANTINGNSNLTFTKTTGTLATFALTVTSNGTFGNINTSGTETATRFISNIATGTAPLTVTSTTRVANLSVDYSNVADFINVTAPGTGTGYIIFANATTGNVAEWTTAGITSNLANNSITATTFVGALSGAATSATTAGTVTTNAQPNITSTGTLTSLIVGNATANTTFGNGIFTATGNANVGNLGTAGLIVATGNVTGGNLVTGGQLSVTGIGTIGGVVLPTWNLGGTDISTVGGGSAATGRTLLGWNRSSGGGEFNIITNRNGGGAGGVKFYEWANTLSNTTTEIFSVTATGAVTTPSTIVATGNVTGGNLVTGGIVSATGNITTGDNSNVISGRVRITSNAAGGYFNQFDNSSLFIGANGFYPLTIASGTSNTTGNISIGSNLSVTGNVTGGNISGTLVTGTLVTAAQPNITSLGTLTGLGVNGTVTAVNITANTGVFTGNANGISSVQAGNIVGTTLGATVVTSSLTTVGTLGSLTVTGNVTGGNLVTGGVLTVNGTGVSSIAGNLDMTSNTIINLATPTNSTDAATKQYVDDVAQGLNIHDSCNAATNTTLAIISGGTITYNNGTAGVGATLTTTGSYTTIDGVTLVNGMRILVKNEATTANNGIYVLTSSTVLTRAADFNTVPEVEAGDFTFVTAGTLYDNTGWVQVETVTTIGTSPIVFTQFSGAGTYTAGTGLTLTGTAFSVNVAQPTITSVGTLTSLGVSGAVTASTLVSNVATGTAPFTVTSTTQVANLSVATAGSATTAGTVTTAAQGNITSVGTLTSLAVTGNGTFGNINTSGTETATRFISNIATGTAPLTVTSTTRVANLNVDYANVADFINVVAGTGNNFIIFANAATGNVTELTSTGLTANLSNNSITATTFVGALSGAATTAGTVTTAAQGNITSVGTLTSLGVSGAVTASTLVSNVATGTAPLTVTSTTRVANLNVAYANVADFSTVVTATTGTYYINMTSALTGNVAEAANANLTFNAATGNLSTTILTVTGNATVGNLTTGAGSGGNISGANVISANTFTATGNVTGANIVSSAYAISSVATGISAAGTVQANATALTKDINVVSTVTAGQGVVLPTAIAGMRITVLNTSANTLLVYPAVNGIINAAAANVAYSSPAGAKLDFLSTTTTQWYTLNTTYN